MLLRIDRVVRFRRIERVERKYLNDGCLDRVNLAR
jgi:hypothetical protein